MNSYEKETAGTKQSIRNKIFEVFTKNPPPVNRPYRFTTLPGTPGFTSRKSLEKMLRHQYPDCCIVGLEYSNRSATRLENWADVFQLYKQHRGLLNKLHYRDIGDYFAVYNSKQQDLVFADLCGGATTKVLNDWRYLFQRDNLSNGAYIGITLNESPRIRRHVVPTNEAFNYIVELCSNHGLNLELIEPPLHYDNGRLNAYVGGRSQPMVFLFMRITYQ